jgi:cell fate regulator YaaT (PSP1 superfamily)
MPEVVGVSVRKIKEISYFNPQGIDLSVGDKCLVETENDLELGEVVEETKIVNQAESDMKKVSRKISPDDIRQLEENKRREQEAFNICLKKIEDKELDMKLVGVSYTFNRNKLFIYYTAPERVDFRELVKDLAYMLKTRIEMCQIGVRDEAKIIGGFGLCGRGICCASFLKDFKPVTIDMAKEQDLSLSSSKVSGLCGRLICCLAYEYEFYNKMRKNMPQVNTRVQTADGPGRVIASDLLKKQVSVQLDEGGVKKFPVDELNKTPLPDNQNQTVPPASNNNKSLPNKNQSPKTH